MVLATADTAEALEINHASCTKQSGNELRFDCDVETDVAATVRIDFCDATENGTSCTKDRSTIDVQGTYHTASCHAPLLTCWKYDVPVWGLIESHDHEWAAVAEKGASSHALGGTDFTSGTLADELGYISATTSMAPVETEFILLNYGCGSGTVQADHAIIMNTDGDVIWYEDVRDVTGDSGAWIRAIRVDKPSQNVMVVVDNDWYIEYDRSGEVIASLERDAGDFEDAAGVDRHVHHDVYKKGGELFLVTAHEETWEEEAKHGSCNGDGDTDDSFTYIVDGIMVFDSDYNYDRDWSMTDAFPAEECHFFETSTGPGYWWGTYTNKDWVHANSIFVDADADWLISLNHPSVVVEIDGSTGAANWALHGDNTETGEGDWDIVSSPTVTPDDFNKQHHAWWTVDDTMMLFDNRLDEAEDSRGIEIEFDSGNSEFDIIDEWDTGFDCPATGSTFDILPRGNILTTCSKEGSRNDKITEFARSTGSKAYELTLTCATGSGYNHNTSLYRAEPIGLD